MTTETLMTAATPTPDAAASAAAPAADTTAAPADGAAPAASAPADGSQAKPADDAAAKPAETPAGAPEKYEPFKLPENTLTADEVASVEKQARDLNLSQETAQKLAELKASDKAAQTAAMQQAVADARSTWVSEISGDKELGGPKLPATLAVAKQGLQSIDPTGEVSKLLAATGFGDHPAVIRMFHRVGLSTQEDRIVPAVGAPPGSTDAASVLYPTKSQGA